MYLDLLMLLNFGVDYLLLLGTQRFFGARGNRGRLLASAALGAIYSGGCLVPGFQFLGGIHWRLVFLGLMSAAAFGVRPDTARKAGVFCILSFALGGMATLAVRGNALTLLLCAMALCAACRILVGGRAAERLVPLRIAFGGRELRLTALRDTGNTLRDPISGERVLILSQPEAEKLTGLTAHQLENPMETLQQQPLRGLRLIPYHAVGKDGGLLLGMRIREVTVDGKTAPAVVAFAPNRFGDTNYAALVGGNA